MQCPVGIHILVLSQGLQFNIQTVLRLQFVFCIQLLTVLAHSNIRPQIITICLASTAIKHGFSQSRVVQGSTLVIFYVPATIQALLLDTYVKQSSYSLLNFQFLSSKHQPLYVWDVYDISVTHFCIQSATLSIKKKQLCIMSSFNLELYTVPPWYFYFSDDNTL